MSLKKPLTSKSSQIGNLKEALKTKPYIIMNVDDNAK